MDESDWDFESKLTLLRKAHEEDLQLSGGANGLQSSLVEAMGVWPHLDLDAVYFTARCSHCCRSTTRASCNAAAPPRTLPGKLEALNVVGMDLKTMSGDEGLPPWTLLVLVCFASTKIWTKDFDGGPAGKGGATLAGVQSYVRDWTLSVVNHAPVVWWADNGGQFKNVINDLNEALFGTVPIFIPPGHPASNGLTERMNSMLGRLGNDRSKLQSVTAALNNACRSRHNCPPEVLYRLLLPSRSTLTHQAVRQALHAAGASGQQVDRDAFLAQYTELVEKLESEGIKQDQIDEHATAVSNLTEAMASRQLRIDIGKRLAWDRGSRKKSIVFYTGDLVWIRQSQVGAASSSDKYEQGSFKVIAVLGQLLEVKEIDPNAEEKTGKKRTIHRDSARLAVLDITKKQRASRIRSRRMRRAQTRQDSSHNL